MPRPLIAVTDSVFPSLDPAKAALKRVDPQLRMAKSAGADDILAVARDADAILVTYAKLPGELLRQLTRCKAIGRFGLGVDNIDIKAAAELGITVTYVPDYCMHEVSDHAMALLLALARKVPGAGARATLPGRVCAMALGVVMDEASDVAVRDALDDFDVAMRPYRAGLYPNFVEEQADASAFFEPAVWERLRAVKALYDPADVFAGNHHVPPARG